MQEIIFLNTGWMYDYKGLIGRDSEIKDGGSFVNDEGYGLEIFNFKEIDGEVYGYVQPMGLNNLNKLGGTSDDEYVEDILIVFTAKYEKGGTYIVEWYKNATFFKEYQETNLKERKFKNEYLGYYAKAEAKNVTLLNTDERLAFPSIPRGVKGGMGQSNVWYADSDLGKEFAEKVRNYIDGYEVCNRNR